MQLPEKVELAFLPTPIYKLEKLSKPVSYTHLTLPTTSRV